MRIAGAGSAFPKHHCEQAQITAALQNLWRGKLDKPELLDRMHSRTGVERRYMTLPLDAYVAVDTFGKANNIWIETAQQLAVDAICRAITPAGIEPQDVDAIFFTSVTGISAPSIDGRLVNRMGLSPNVKRTPMFGLGCAAGAAGLGRAADYVRAYPDQIAVLLSVELCSLTWQRTDISVPNIIASGLFGDGAAAVVLAGKETGYTGGPEVVASRSILYRGTEEVLGWDISETGFRILLAPELPRMVEENFRNDAERFLALEGLQLTDVHSWIIHTGGVKVIQAVQDSLGLPQEALQPSWDLLREAGNLSSAAVLVLLQQQMARRDRPPAGAYTLMAAMGPGFSVEMVLLRW